MWSRLRHGRRDRRQASGVGGGSVQGAAVPRGVEECWVWLRPGRGGLQVVPRWGDCCRLSIPPAQRDPGWELPTRSVQAAVAGTALGGIEASLGLGPIGGVGWGGLGVRPFAKEWGGASPLRTGTVSCLDTAVRYCLAWRRKMQINQPASQPCGLLLAAGPGS